jgi:hypothetical protein
VTPCSGRRWFPTFYRNIMILYSLLLQTWVTADSLETLVTIHQIIWSHNPEDNNLNLYFYKQTWSYIYIHKSRMYPFTKYMYSGRAYISTLLVQVTCFSLTTIRSQRCSSDCTTGFNYCALQAFSVGKFLTCESRSVPPSVHLHAARPGSQFPQSPWRPWAAYQTAYSGSWHTVSLLPTYNNKGSSRQDPTSWATTGHHTYPAGSSLPLFNDECDWRVKPPIPPGCVTEWSYDPELPVHTTWICSLFPWE